MKVSVCASLTYYYDVEVPDKLCKLDDNGHLKYEAKLTNLCAEADPAILTGVSDNVVNDIISIHTDDECLYCW
jgi:hypothetical protein